METEVNELKGVHEHPVAAEARTTSLVQQQATGGKPSMADLRYACQKSPFRKPYQKRPTVTLSFDTKNLRGPQG